MDSVTSYSPNICSVIFLILVKYDRKRTRVILQERCHELRNQGENMYARYTIFLSIINLYRASEDSGQKNVLGGVSSGSHIICQKIPF